MARAVVPCSAREGWSSALCTADRPTRAARSCMPCRRPSWPRSYPTRTRRSFGTECSRQHLPRDHMSHTGPIYEGEPVVREQPFIVRTKQVVKTGASFGSALAIAISWSVHKSLLWAIIHGILSWFYVIYYA